ncbi:hypothetical protein BV25DRAFT_1736377, partial [Artomyces pyxidatus]
LPDARGPRVPPRLRVGAELRARARHVVDDGRGVRLRAGQEGRLHERRELQDPVHAPDLGRGARVEQQLLRHAQELQRQRAAGEVHRGQGRHLVRAAQDDAPGAGRPRRVGDRRREGRRLAEGDDPRAHDAHEQPFPQLRRHDEALRRHRAGAVPGALRRRWGVLLAEGQPRCAGPCRAGGDDQEGVRGQESVVGPGRVFPAGAWLHGHVRGHEYGEQAVWEGGGARHAADGRRRVVSEGGQDWGEGVVRVIGEKFVICRQHLDITSFYLTHPFQCCLFILLRSV